MSKMTKEVKSPGSRKEILTGVVTLGATGALNTTSHPGGVAVCDGFTVEKTASKTGRYTVKPMEPYVKIEYAHAVVEGAADANAAAAKGQVCKLRNVNAGSKSLDVQFVTPSLAAGAEVDVNPEDNAILRFLVVASRGQL